MHLGNSLSRKVADVVLSAYTTGIGSMTSCDETVAPGTFFQAFYIIKDTAVVVIKDDNSEVSTEVIVRKRNLGHQERKTPYRFL